MKFSFGDIATSNIRTSTVSSVKGSSSSFVSVLQNDRTRPFGSFSFDKINAKIASKPQSEGQEHTSKAEGM